MAAQTNTVEKKTAIPGLFKQGDGVLINKDAIGLQNYKIRKQRERKLNEFEERMEQVQTDIAMIKSLLGI